MEPRILTRLLVAVVALTSMAFRCNRNEQALYLSMQSDRIFRSTDEKITIRINADNREGKRVRMRFRAFRISDPIEFLLAQRDLSSPDFVSDYDDEERREWTPPSARRHRVVAEWNFDHGQRRYVGDIEVPVKERGLYLVEGWFEGKRATTALVISDAQVVLKQSPTASLAFVTDRNTGQRIEGMRLGFRSSDSRHRGMARTGSDGVAELTGVTDQSKRSRETTRHLLVVGEQEGNIVICSDGFRIAGEEAYRVHVQTDRPIYRPEQRMAYRGIVRRMAEGGAYRTTAAASRSSRRFSTAGGARSLEIRSASPPPEPFRGS